MQDQDVIKVHDQYYILATAARRHEPTRVLKHGDTFALFDTYGDITSYGSGEQGLYHEGTRFLSRLHLRVNGQRPLLLSSSVRELNDVFGADLTNPDIVVNSEVVLPRDLLHIFRARLLWRGRWYERLRLANYAQAAMDVHLTFDFGADFADIFEVRGIQRERRGTLQEADLGPAQVVLAYVGLDGQPRRTTLAWSPAPNAISPTMARFDVTLAAQASQVITLTITCEGAMPLGGALAYEAAAEAATEAAVTARRRYCHVYTSNEQFNDWLNRSVSDVQVMMTETRHGPYPYAGVPWFNTVFGRDGIITALELLWMNPDVAKGVLSFLAATQAQARNVDQDAEPGKILHEMRDGEMARLGEVPFGRYYGSVDATPLFVVLAGRYYRRTADRALIESMWPNIELALTWMDRYGDMDGDGFVEYARRSGTGLVHQGWKDSTDSVFHADGTLAEPPIALSEVQAYVYEAKRQAAELAAALGRPDRAETLLRQAEDLRQRFEVAFWSEELSTYALALDGQKRPCLVKASNAGHCLFAGIASRDRARRVAQTLVGAESFSGWGVRTIAAGQPRYNPMSYHNGSVWPHDNALIAAGLSRYGLRDQLFLLFSGLFDASLFVERYRLPELFCGFHRRTGGEAPTLYPVACAPQAWAAGAVFLLLQACLGLTLDAVERQVSFRHAMLPSFLDRVRLTNLRVGDATVDLEIERHTQDVGVTVQKREGDVTLAVLS